MFCQSTSGGNEARLEEGREEGAGYTIAVLFSLLRSDVLFYW